MSDNAVPRVWRLAVALARLRWSGQAAVDLSVRNLSKLALSTSPQFPHEVLNIFL